MKFFRGFAVSILFTALLVLLCMMLAGCPDDELQFNKPHPVPEPESLWLLIAGVVGAGAALVRRRK